MSKTTLDVTSTSMRTTPELDARTGLEKLATYPYAILTWVGDAGYPVSVAIETAIDAPSLTASFRSPVGLSFPLDRQVSLTGSHIRPQPGYGYDERRHVTVWGRTAAQVTDDASLTKNGAGLGSDASLTTDDASLTAAEAGLGGDASPTIDNASLGGNGPAGPEAGQRITFTAGRAWGWDEAEVPFFEYSERATGQSRKYFDALSRERGTPVKPRLSLGFLMLRTTRLPFLSATVVPVVLGLAIAASQGLFDPLTAVLTLVGACFVQLGINVSNDVFDSVQGADDANVTPTQFSGGSRVIQYGLVSLRQMATLATTFYLAAALIGLVLLALSPSAALLAIGIIGFVVGLGYTAPPLKFVYRGLGEIAVAIGFGPLMLLGAYVVQSGGSIGWEAVVASIPVALFVALILYVNEIPDRRGDAHAGKRTLPVRLPCATVVAGYRAMVVVAYAVTAVGVAVGLLPVSALLVLISVPLALRVSRSLLPNYDNPYGLMAVMGVNIKLHLVAGVMLILAYVVVLLAGAMAPGVDLFLR